MKVILPTGTSYELENPEEVKIYFNFLSGIDQNLTDQPQKQPKKANGFKCLYCNRPLTGGRRKCCGRKRCVAMARKEVYFNKVSKTRQPIKCLVCGKELPLLSHKKKYCGKECSHKAKILADREYHAKKKVLSKGKNPLSALGF